MPRYDRHGLLQESGAEKGLDLIAKAIPSGIKAFQEERRYKAGQDSRAEDRRMRQTEMDAKLSAQAQSRDRSEFEQNMANQELELRRRKAGFKVGDEGGLIADPEFQQRQLEISEGKRKGQTDRHLQKDWMSLSKVAVNPSSRRKAGRYQMNIDAADAVFALTEGIGVPHGQFPPANETHEALVKRLDEADSRQIAEVVRSLDRMLTQGVPTQHGMEELTPQTTSGLIRKFGEKIMGSPKGLSQGAFLAKYLDTVTRERNMNIMKQDQTLQKLGLGFEHLQDSDPERFKQLLMSEPLVQMQPQVYFSQNPQDRSGGLVSQGLVSPGMIEPPQETTRPTGFMGKLGGLLGGEAGAAPAPAPTPEVKVWQGKTYRKKPNGDWVEAK